MELLQAWLSKAEPPPALAAGMERWVPAAPPARLSPAGQPLPGLRQLLQLTARVACRRGLAAFLQRAQQQAQEAEAQHRRPRYQGPAQPPAAGLGLGATPVSPQRGRAAAVQEHSEPPGADAHATVTLHKASRILRGLAGPASGGQGTAAPSRATRPQGLPAPHRASERSLQTRPSPGWTASCRARWPRQPPPTNGECAEQATMQAAQSAALRQYTWPCQDVAVPHAQARLRRSGSGTHTPSSARSEYHPAVSVLSSAPTSAFVTPDASPAKEPTSRASSVASLPGSPVRCACVAAAARSTAACQAAQEPGSQRSTAPGRHPATADGGRARTVRRSGAVCARRQPAAAAASAAPSQPDQPGPGPRPQQGPHRAGGTAAPLAALSRLPRHVCQPGIQPRGLQRQPGRPSASRCPPPPTPCCRQPGRWRAHTQSPTPGHSSRQPAAGRPGCAGSCATADSTSTAWAASSGGVSTPSQQRSAAWGPTGRPPDSAARPWACSSPGPASQSPRSCRRPQGPADTSAWLLPARSSRRPACRRTCGPSPRAPARPGSAQPTPWPPPAPR